MAYSNRRKSDGEIKELGVSPLRADRAGGPADLSPDGSQPCGRSSTDAGAFEAIIILYMLGIVSAGVAFNMGWIG